jgi:hypothetical protein
VRGATLAIKLFLSFCFHTQHTIIYILFTHPIT